MLGNKVAGAWMERPGQKGAPDEVVERLQGASTEPHESIVKGELGC